MNKAAKAIRAKLCIECECTFDKGCGCLEAINEALVEERERCAKLVEEYVCSTAHLGALVQMIRNPVTCD